MPTDYGMVFRPTIDWTTTAAAADRWTYKIGTETQVVGNEYLNERTKDQLTEEIGLKVFKALKKIIEMNVSEQEFMDVLMGE